MSDTALGVSADTSAEEKDGRLSNVIDDSQFMTELNNLRKLRSFLNNEAVIISLSREESDALGMLFTLTENRYGGGRAPTGPEWTKLDYFNQLFFQRITDAQRRRFLVGGIPDSFSRLPLLFAAIAFLALIVSAILPFLVKQSLWSSVGVLPFYLTWLIALGGMGSIAFIGMNALSVQQDITFDLLNPRLINLRVALGCLFALVLTLPFGYEGYVKFLRAIVLAGSGAAQAEQDKISTSDGAMLILPFLLGFSTSLVIMILNRLLEAAQSFFGKPVVGSPPPAPDQPRQGAAPAGAGRSERPAGWASVPVQVPARHDHRHPTNAPDSGSTAASSPAPDEPPRSR